MENEKKLTKVKRNTVVIAGKDGVAHLLNKDDDIFKCCEEDSTMTAELKLLIELLEEIPNNDNIIEKPYKIILPEGGGGLATGCYLDWIRTGKSIINGRKFSKNTLDLFMKILDLMSHKYLNVELVPETYSTSEEEKKLIEKVKNAKITEDEIIYGYDEHDEEVYCDSYDEEYDEEFYCGYDYDYENSYAHYKLTGEYLEDGIDEDFAIAQAIDNMLE